MMKRNMNVFQIRIAVVQDLLAVRSASMGMCIAGIENPIAPTTSAVQITQQNGLNDAMMIVMTASVCPLVIPNPVIH
jgi:hypothetical protein